MGQTKGGVLAEVMKHCIFMPDRFIYLNPASLREREVIDLPPGTTLVLDSRLPKDSAYVTGTKLEWAK